MPLRVNVDRALGQQGKRPDVLCTKSLHPKLKRRRRRLASANAFNGSRRLKLQIPSTAYPRGAIAVTGEKDPP
jgi:hypothetical protein